MSNISNPLSFHGILQVWILNVFKIKSPILLRKMLNCDILIYQQICPWLRKRNNRIFSCIDKSQEIFSMSHNCFDREILSSFFLIFLSPWHLQIFALIISFEKFVFWLKQYCRVFLSSLHLHNILNIVYLISQSHILSVNWTKTLQFSFLCYSVFHHVC